MSDDPLALAKQRRAELRRSWPGWRGTWQDGPPTPAEDLLAATTAAERVAMVWQVTLNAWALAGRELPSYTRAEMPGRLTSWDDDECP